MKTGRTLQELAAEIMRQQENKRDFVAPSSKLTMEHGVDGVALAFDAVRHTETSKVTEVQSYAIGDTAHDQLATFVDIPRKYYDRMLASSPELLARNVNHWLQSSRDSRMVRTLDGKVRGILSDRFRALDHFALAEAVLPVLQMRKLDLLSCEITERRLYIKAVDPQLALDVPKGSTMGSGHTIFDTCSPAITISNSEIGFGSLNVEAGVWTRQCTNMATFSQHSTKRYHVGKRQGGADFAREVMASQTTQRLEDAALWSLVRDTVLAAFDRAKFDSKIKLLTDAGKQEITGDPVKVVELAAATFELTDGERGSVLTHLIKGGDLSRYGLFNAITRAAEDVDSYDRATEIERLGADVVMLPANDWKRIAAAASEGN